MAARHPWTFRAIAFLAAVTAGAGFLLVPDLASPTPLGGGAKPFLWGSDDRWGRLEATFVDTRRAGCETAAPAIEARLNAILESLAALETAGRVTPDDPILARLEESVFEAAARVAACPAAIEGLESAVARTRAAVKRASVTWEYATPARERLYRLLYGSRVAVEEALLQAPSEVAHKLAVTHGDAQVSSQAPAAMVHGVRVESGDILLSRGGAPTSALISRGNDRPGNFSHVALAHVDRVTGKVSAIESHIERGVVVSSAEEYFADKKLRVLVLRLREGRGAPGSPERAADFAMASVRARHIPYDFAMNFDEHGRQFCSEVAQAAYEHEGVPLWEAKSTLSARGVVLWLSSLGVENFTTLAPADLEYDPKVALVVEWRNPETLWSDHLDNAIVDAMLEEADEGRKLEYAWWLLPPARALKAYSAILNWTGRVGPVPEGMSAQVALRVRALTARHAKTRELLEARAADFKRERGHLPPYWELVALAREAIGRPRRFPAN